MYFTLFAPALLFSPDTVRDIGQILTVGLGIFIGIEALKNSPLFADFFLRWPKLGIIVNALAALFIAIGKCLGGESDMTIVFCLLTAVGVFLAAAGIHLSVKKLSRGTNVVSGAVSNSARVKAGLPPQA